MSQSLITIRGIAHDTRRWAKSLQREYPHAFGSDLSCMCGIANFELFKRLKRRRFRVFMRSNSIHCFLEWGKYVLDITATQFGDYPAVAIVDPKARRGEEFWYKRSRRLGNLRKAKQWFSQWPSEQCPFRYQSV